MSIDAITPPLSPLPVAAVATGDSLAALSAPEMAGIAAPAAAVATSVVAPPVVAETPATTAALATAVADAAGRQDSLAPLLTDLTHALRTPGLPASVQTAATRVLALQLPLNPAPTADGLRQALAGSGLLLEAKLAASSAPLGPDLKASLLQLSAALEAAPAAAAQGPAQAPPAPPPYRGGPIAAQAAALPSLAPDAPAQAVAHRLLHETTAAIARQVLLQAASSPAASRQPGEMQSALWMFEIPFQNAGVAQFEIARDGGGHGHDGAGAEPVWRARFSLNVPPIGPVHASIAMSDGAARVTLWAEDSTTHEKLSAAQGDLAQALAAEQLTPSVAVYPGSPTTPPPAAGRLVDQAT
jgi:hypothetical protein